MGCVAAESAGGNRHGQAMIEYVTCVVILIVSTVAMLAVFLYVLREENTRVLDLVASEYP